MLVKVSKNSKLSQIYLSLHIGAISKKINNFSKVAVKKFGQIGSVLMFIEYNKQTNGQNKFIQNNIFENFRRIKREKKRLKKVFC